MTRTLAGGPARVGALTRFQADQVFMIRRPALRFLTRPVPPRDLEARRLAAVIRPPLLFFMVAAPLPLEWTPTMQAGGGAVCAQSHGGGWPGAA